MSVQEDHRRGERTLAAEWAETCPTWCSLDPGHVVAERSGGATGVLHRGAESVVTCHGSAIAALVHEAVEIRVYPRWWIEFDDALGAWVAEPEPTVHVSGLPDYPLRPRDALALAVALAEAAGPMRCEGR